MMQHLVSNTFPISDYSCIVVKYCREGKRLWVTEYPGTPRATAVDPNGNVYLGLSWNASGRPNRFGTSDYVILKLSPEGTVLWRTVYDGPWGGQDLIGALSVDQGGSVYVTGVANHVYGSRIATLKLDAGGSIVWLGLHTIPNDNPSFSFTAGSFFYTERQPFFLTVDSTGAVSVACRSSVSYNPETYDLVHFDMSGREQWAQTSPGKLRGMASDPSGDVYLATDGAITRVTASGAVRWTQESTGVSFLRCKAGLLFTESIADGRMVTRAFDTTGTPRWTAVAPGGTGVRDSSMAFVNDQDGNVTAVGTRIAPDGNTDIAGYSYDVQGTQLGVLHYDGPALSSNWALVSAVNNDGNIVIAGSVGVYPALGVLAIVEYGPSGNMLFALRESGPGARNVVPAAIAFDKERGIRIAGLESNGAMKILSYANDGQFRWSVSSSQSLSPKSMATDARDNVIVAGSSNRDVILIAFGSDGREKWIQRYAGFLPSRPDFELRLDSADNVYLGATVGTSQTSTSVLLKNSREGQLLWERRLSEYPGINPGMGDQEFGGFSVDPAGHVVVAAKVWNSSGSSSILTICYSPAGEVLWHADSHDGLVSFFPVYVLHCADGDVWITGRGFIRNYGSFIFASKFDSYGNQKSNADIPDDSFDPVAAAVDAWGSLYVTGNPGSYGSGEDMDIVTICFGPSGSQSWIERFDAAPHAFDYAVGVAVAPDGGTIVTGYSKIPVQDGPPRGTGTFFTAIKYEPLPAPGSLVANPGFEKEMASWTFHSAGSAKAFSVTGGEKSPLAACVAIDRPDSTITLFQAGIPLEPRTRYRLTFSGRCNTGHDVEVSLIKNTEPYASYGLSGTRCDLGKEWTSVSMDYVTEWFTTLVNDGRIIFRMGGLAEAGDEYCFDNIVLERIGPPDFRTVVRHPADAVSGIGQRAMFRVVAPHATSYQWLRNGTNIRGATWDRYATPVLAAADSGAEFSCVVTGPAGVLTTRAASLTVRNTPVSLVANHRFENGRQGWSFPSGTAATFTVEGPPNIGHAAIHQEGTSLQLMTTGIELIEGARYRLRFRARNVSGHDLAVGLLKHTAPFTGYGLGLKECDLTPDWKEFSVPFVAAGFQGTVSDGRLMFWMAPYTVAGDDYFFDDVQLEEIIEGTTTGIGQEQVARPLTFRLEQNFPNPFNPETTIRFSIAEREQIRLAVYDVLGKEVAILAEGMLAAGEHFVRYRPDGLASGVYIYRLEGARQVATGKMLMVR